jgi:hypothetical protein
VIPTSSCPKLDGWVDVRDLKSELGSLWLKASATLMGGITSGEGFHDWVWAGRAPFYLYSGICLTTEEKHGKPQCWVLHVASTWPPCRGGLDWPAVHPSSSVDREGLQTALGRRRCLPSRRTKGFPYQITLSRRSRLMP